MLDKLAKLFGRKVEVKAQGVLYRGRLAGADEEFIYLKGETTWITLPVERVSAVRPEGGGEGDWEMKDIPGAPKPGPEEKKQKKRYSDADLKRLHSGQGGAEWPDPHNQEIPPEKNSLSSDNQDEE